jgi:hypothetical protein
MFRENKMGRYVAIKIMRVGETNRGKTILKSTGG